MGCIISRVDKKEYNSTVAKCTAAFKEGRISNILETPTHVIDIYKMRRGQYKNIRIWTKINLGNGERKDLFITTADNMPLPDDKIIELYADSYPEIYNWREDYVPPENRKG